MKKIISFLLFIISFLVFSPGVVKADVTWSETQPGGNHIWSWKTSAISSDGHKMLVANEASDAYLSSDSGNSWSNINPADNEDWYTSSMSSDGQVILLGSYGDQLFLSKDGGSTWAATQPLGNVGANWISTSMSSDGQIILASTDSGRLYRTIDGGTTWSEIRPVGDQNFSWRTAMSANGRIMLASGDDGLTGARLYISTDTGSSWAETRPGGDTSYGWQTVSMSSNGQIMLAGVSGGHLYLSTNAGSSWEQTIPQGDGSGSWILSRISSDGRTMLASSTERLYFSNNGGDSWQETMPIGNQNGNWQLIALSGNSNLLLAGNYDARLYLGINPLLSQPAVSNNSGSCTDSTPDSIPDLFQLDAAGTYVNLYFTKPSGNVSGYTINYGLDSKANQYADTFDYAKPDWIIGRTISYLAPNTTYYFKIQARNGCNAGAWSKIVSIKTKNKTAAVANWFANLAK